MVDVRSRRCSHGTCTKVPSFNVLGSKTGVYCKQHADNYMLDVRSKHCSHHSCTGWPRWGVISDCSGSVCSQHKNSLPAGLVVDFKQRCEVTGCRAVARWGIAETQPTHCPAHGRLREGLSCTVGSDPTRNTSSSSSFSAERGASLCVKAECLY